VKSVNVIIVSMFGCCGQRTIFLLLASYGRNVANRE